MGDLKTLITRRKRFDAGFRAAGLVATLVGVLILLALLVDLAADGLARVSWQFLTSYPSRFAAEAGILSAWVGTSLVMLITALVFALCATPTFLFLRERAQPQPKTENPWARVLHTIRHARQFKSVEIPLFPRYIFVKLDLSRDRWRSINGTAGVSKLVTVLDRPLPLPEGLVETLMTAHACRSQWALGDEFQVNKPVQMSYGPFAELIGRIQRVDDRGRVHVLLEIMGRAVSVQTTVSQMRLLTACVAEPRSAPHLARTICPDR